MSLIAVPTANHAARKVIARSTVARANKITVNPAPFNMLTLAPQVWYDVSTVPGALVDLPVLSDLSGNGFNATGGTGKPDIIASTYMGKSTLRSTAGNSDIMTLAVPWGAAFSFVMVCTASAVASSYMTSGQGNINGIISHFNVTSLEWYENGATNGYVFNTAPAAGLHILQVDHTDGGNAVGFYDGVQAFSAAARTTTAGQNFASIFADPAPGAFATFDLCEMAKFPRVLTLAERSAAYGALKIKWGTP